MAWGQEAEPGLGTPLWRWLYLGEAGGGVGKLAGLDRKRGVDLPGHGLQVDRHRCSEYAGRWRSRVSTHRWAGLARGCGGTITSGVQEIWSGTGWEWFHTAVGPRGEGYTCDSHEDAPGQERGPSNDWSAVSSGGLFLRHMGTTGPNAGVLPVLAGAEKGVGGQRDVRVGEQCLGSRDHPDV